MCLKNMLTVRDVNCEIDFLHHLCVCYECEVRLDYDGAYHNIQEIILCSLQGGLPAVLYQPGCKLVCPALSPLFHIHL